MFWLNIDAVYQENGLFCRLIHHVSRRPNAPGFDRAYVGLRIFVIKYDTYQNLESYKGRHKGRPSSELGHNNKNGNNNGKNIPDFFSLHKRYPDQDLITQVFQAIASTRKSGKVSDSILVAQLKKWKRYPIQQVEAGIRIYLDRDCASQGKRENYLLAIISNHQTQTEAKPKSTGSSLLDEYYAKSS